jgi:SAM-dependent methyltransferase
MNDRQVGELWDGNADAWTKLAREGWDVYRDFINTPASFAMLPDVTNLHGLDIGCGEGHNTRLLSQRGARVTAVDISRVFLRHALQMERESPLGISYCAASGQTLPFADRTFDFSIAFMSLMDVPDPDRLIAETHRVLKPGGFLQFSICHPCFDTPHRRNLRDAHGHSYAVEVGDYFRSLDGELTEWFFSAAPLSAKAGLPKFKIPRFTRTLSQWLNSLLDAGFVLERIEEPRPSDETVLACPNIQDAQVVPYCLHVMVRRPY